jgi:fumarylacetoacetate (FAA) hydrolase
MKLATLRDGSRDGRLVVVRFDGLAVRPADDRWPTLQRALDDWRSAEPVLRGIAASLDSGDTSGATAMDINWIGAPLPRAYEWVDGSAFLNHVRLVRKARNAEPPPTLEQIPLIYQGGSGEMLGARDPFVPRDPRWGLDFEAELGVILDDTPVGTRAADAESHIVLVVLLNDWTYRGLVPDELGRSFGFFQSKPATSFAPFAVTPDELGAAWQGARAHLRVRTTLNGNLVGDVESGPEMHFSFADLIQHMTRTRNFVAGTIVGSGTVSNADRSRGVSCLAELKMLELIDGVPPQNQTRMLAEGDTVRIEAVTANGTSPFGAIEAAIMAPQ